MLTIFYNSFLKVFLSVSALKVCMAALSPYWGLIDGLLLHVHKLVRIISKGVECLQLVSQWDVDFVLGGLCL